VPRVGDADFTEQRLVERANQELANGLGNLVSRVTALVRGRDEAAPPETPSGRPADAASRAHAASQEPPPAAEAATALGEAIEHAQGRVRAALEDYDFRAGLAAIWAIVDRANRYAELSEPWRLARAARAGDAAAAARRDLALSRLLEACRALAGALAPFVPGLAASIDVACGGSDGVVPPPRPLFPRLAVHQAELQAELQAVPPAGEHRTTGPAPGPGSETAAEAARERPLAGVNDSVH
jgi:methionyl-tRNA synthetase